LRCADHLEELLDKADPGEESITEHAGQLFLSLSAVPHFFFASLAGPGRVGG
jgi:hypothetical protein